MTVPYGDPRSPYHRKQAFDLGDVGAGLCANELNLGCDCLGEIEYLSFDLVRHNGEVQRLNNVVCVRESDVLRFRKHLADLAALQTSKMRESDGSTR